MSNNTPIAKEPGTIYTIEGIDNTDLKTTKGKVKFNVRASSASEAKRIARQYVSNPKIVRG